MLTAVEVDRLEERVRAVEARTGVQVVVGAVERADLYHGLRWRAFALGAGLAGAALALGAGLRPGLFPAHAPAAVFAAVATVLGAGLASALATTLSSALARVFLEPLRAAAEVRQCAESLFLERGLFATRDRDAVLLLACRFERAAVVLPDTGLRARATGGEWGAVGAAAEAELRAGGLATGLLAGLDELERLLVARGLRPGAEAGNELPDAPVTGKGP